MKTVYVLGAGCSCEDGTPLVNDFFIRIEEFLKTELKDHKKIKNFRKVVKLKKASFDGFNIEEFFSIIDFFISMGIELHPYHIKSIRADLIYLIARTIKHSLKEKTKSLYYEHFYSKLISGDDVIISLNWDLLLDNARDGVNYGATFMRYDLNSKKADVVPRDGMIPILKLHGSLNFLDCTNRSCEARFFSYKSKALQILDKDEKCPTCRKGNLKIILVPPTTFKNLDIFKPLKEVWYSTFEKLRECDRIRFVGYSLPTADVDFKHLLKASMNYRKTTPVIEVYNYKNKNKAREEFEDHYNRMFDEITNLEKPIEFHYTKFSKLVDYLQKG